MEQPQFANDDAPLMRLLPGITVIGLWQLATVSADGTIPLPGTLVLESPAGFVTLSYAQEGLSCQGPVRRAEIRWETEPDLRMDSRGDDEWLSLVPNEDRAKVPELPLFVESVTGWFGTGAYLDVFALILSGRGRSLVIMTTDDFALRCATREEARARADKVAAAMNLVLTERTWSRLDVGGRRVD